MSIVTWEPALIGYGTCRVTESDNYHPYTTMRGDSLTFGQPVFGSTYSAGSPMLSHPSQTGSNLYRILTKLARLHFNNMVLLVLTNYGASPLKHVYLDIYIATLF